MAAFTHNTGFGSPARPEPKTVTYHQDTTPEMKLLLERLAKMRGISQVEMFEYALTVMADAMDRQASAEKKGKRK